MAGIDAPLMGRRTDGAVGALCAWPYEKPVIVFGHQTSVPDKPAGPIAGHPGSCSGSCP